MVKLFHPVYTFRERAPEWVLSIGLLMWGIATSWHPEIFQSSSFAPLLYLADPQTWVVWTTSVAMFRLVFLAINGAWRPTPHLRAIGSVGGFTIWGSLFFISVFDDTNQRVTGIALYGMLVAFELMALWWAAGDAKIVDQMQSLKKQVNNGN